MELSQSQFVVLTLVLVFCILSFIGFILRSVGLFSLARKTGQSKKAFLAVFPIGQDFLFGFFARKTYIRLEQKNRIIRSMHVVKPVASSVFMSLFIIALTLPARYYITDDYQLLVRLLTELCVGFAAISACVDAACFFGFLRGYYKTTGAIIIVHFLLSIYIPVYSGIILLYLVRNRRNILSEPGVPQEKIG